MLIIKVIPLKESMFHETLEKHTQLETFMQRFPSHKEKSITFKTFAGFYIGT